MVERILEFTVDNNLVVSSFIFIKRDSHLIKQQSSENLSLINYMLVKQQTLKLVNNVKNECVTKQ